MNISDPIAVNCTDHQLEFVTRSDWLAEAPRKRLEQLTTPVSKAIIAHTATEYCTTKVS